MEQNVNFFKRIPKSFVYQKQFQKIIILILKKEKLSLKSQVNVVFLSPNEIRQLNIKYRNIDKISDVLSFPFDYKFSKTLMLGEIIFCHSKILLQAKSYNNSLKREYCYLFAHSFYHLLGYDHQNQEDEKRMNYLVNEILHKINVHR